MNKKEFEALKLSIQEHGQTQPIQVRPIKDGYEIVGGYHRWLAMKELKFLEVEVNITPMGDDEAKIFSLQDNIHGNDDLLRLGKLVYELTEKGFSIKKIAQVYGTEEDALKDALKVAHEDIAKKLQKLKDETRAADAQINLQRLKAESDAIKEVGEKIAAAKAQSEGSRIKGDSAKSQAEFNASAYDIETETIISGLKLQNEEIYEKQREADDMLIQKTHKTSEIESQKFKQLVKAIGRDAILAMSKSGPENRAKLLKGLGLEGYLVTDGKTPINLFSAANGLVAQNNPSAG